MESVRLWLCRDHWIVPLSARIMIAGLDGRFSKLIFGIFFVELLIVARSSKIGKREEIGISNIHPLMG